MTDGADLAVRWWAAQLTFETSGTASTGPELVRSAGAVFADWQDAFAALFRRHALPEERCRSLAALIVAAEEGAVVLCRAQQTTAPIEAVAAEIHELLLYALSPRP